MDGIGLTVIDLVTKQPVGRVYVIIVVPNDTLVTTPVLLLMVATDVFELLQVPPVEVLAKVIAALKQANVGPVIAAGNGFTIIVSST